LASADAGHRLTSATATIRGMPGADRFPRLAPRIVTRTGTPHSRSHFA
jgi:hypothetical protein